jgi:hypothetical protein
VVGVDGWVNIGNPFKDTSHGELHVLLAMGSENQVLLQSISLNICALGWGNFEAAFAKKIFLCGMWHLFIVVFRSVNY